MTRRSLPLLVLPALFLLLGPSGYWSYAHVQPENAFRMKIVDPKNGEGVPGVRVRSDNGIVCHSRYDGEIAWTETVLMGRDVRFTVDSEDQRSRQVVTLHVTPGSQAQVSLP